MTHQKNHGCYGQSKDPPCDTAYSNNVMDYNTFQNAWTPCQLGKIHYNFAKLNSRQRKLLLPNWCKVDTSKNITITDIVTWDCMKDLEGNLIIKDGGELTINCRLSIPENGYIHIKAGGSLILNNCLLHNACGLNWQGIFSDKEKRKKGKLILNGQVVFENMID